MKHCSRSMLELLLILCLIFSLVSPIAVRAEGEDIPEDSTESSTEATESAAETTEKVAEDISSLDLVTASEGFPKLAFLFNKRVLEGNLTYGNSSLTLEHEGGMGSLYLTFNRAYGTYQITDNAGGTTITVGEHGFIHEFIDLVDLFGKAPTSVTLTFDHGPVHLFEIQVFTEGKVPDTVQKWLPPAEGNADLAVFSAHGDDEQLFFAGSLPYYAGELDYNVQVVYMTSHPKEPRRMHEMLDGLWAVGVENYPVFGDAPDFFSKNLADTYAAMKNLGFPREDLLGFYVEQMRRFKPMVVLTHDLSGEYGHGMHQATADLVGEAVSISADPEKYPESAEKYGVWDVPKTYMHLYDQNEVIMDWDRPLEHFDGKTAFEVSRDIGFPAHKSQFQDFAWYMNYSVTSKDVPKYPPYKFGLYRSTVGEDKVKEDFFENVHTHEEQARLDEEARLEAERLAAEEEEKRRQEEAQRLAEEARLAEEEQKRQEAAEEEARQAAEAQKIQQEKAQKQDQVKFTVSVTADIILLGLVVLLLILRIKKNRD